jgi:DNA helicase-2/ATP-dependent DNA helicase PcrA
MDHIVDLHIHSHYSRATSKGMNIQSLYRWGKLKGIHVMGTGDFTHPEWFAELREKLEPAEPGLFKLKEELAAAENKSIPESCRKNPIRFVLSVEISNIYSKGGKVRKLHNLIIVPSFEVASAINARLQQIGNIKADGRPILGLDSKELLKIALEADQNAIFIPAHIWTPWFGMFGSKSGFDSIAEAFDELAPEIKAVETGLSSDPYMNWRVSQLDGVAIMSNSDAHSPEKLGREASVLRCDLTYADIRDTIRSYDKRFLGTIEFFPQEGKYHYDGHRLCGIRFSPKETREHKGICPKCGLPLVVGVDYRVDELADRPEEFKPKNAKSVEYIIPLVEMIAEVKNVRSVSSKKVKTEYEALVAAVGDEFGILRSVPVEVIETAGFREIGEAIRRLRAGKVVKEPGYDGVYGTIKVFPSQQEVRQAAGQLRIL